MSCLVINGADGPTTVFLAGSLGDMFLLPALFILVLFYAIYFIKMFVQKRHGIETRQLGKRKEKNIRTVEIILSIATLLIVPIQLLSIIFAWNLSPDSYNLGSDHAASADSTGRKVSRYIVW